MDCRDNIKRVISRERAFEMTERFIDRFGDDFLLSKGECKQLTEL